jgi:hypothetical protein
MKANPLTIARALFFVAAVWICFGHNNLTIVQGAPGVVEHSPSSKLWKQARTTTSRSLSGFASWLHG